MPLPAPEVTGVTAPFHATSPGKEKGGDLAATGLHDSQPREAGHLPGFAAVTSAVLQAARPPAAPAPGRRRLVPKRLPPGVGTPLLLLARPSSASSVSEGKSAASFWAPHPRLGNPLSCLRHPSPVSPRQRLLLRASGSPRAARAPSPPRRAAESQRSQRAGEPLEMSDILRELLRVSEKAANIARACRQQEALFQLLVQEKKDAEKNKKFAADFKTLADVLVQEVVKQNMENKFPGLGKKTFGEESNEFTNDLGEKITVELRSTEEETAELLGRVLDGNVPASEALAKVVHQDVDLTDPTLESLEIRVPQDILGIWVDPIDSTYQYIKGSADVKSNQGVFPSGLQCVTILIGVYDIQTGVPLMGVINQPFVSQNLTTLRWTGQYYWGLSYMGTNIHSPQIALSKGTGGETQTENSDGEISRPLSAVISTSEKETIKAALSRVCGGGVFPAAGAGYKSLCVVQGLVDIYIFSEDTTFKWDSCAAHAILRAMGGGIVDMKECLARNPKPGLDLPQLLYHTENKGASGVDLWANKGGLIAYRSRHRLDTFLSCLIQNLGPLKTQT